MHQNVNLIWIRPWQGEKEREERKRDKKEIERMKDKEINKDRERMKDKE